MKYGLMAVICLSILVVYSQSSMTLQSGAPIRNSNTEGFMALPFLSGKISGAIDVDKDGSDDIFLQSSKSGKLYLYSFSKMSGDQSLVFKQPNEVTLPSGEDGKSIRDNAVVFEGTDQHIYGLFAKGKTVNVADYITKDNTFRFKNKFTVNGLPFPFSNIGIVRLKNDKYLMLFAIREQGVFSTPKNDPNKYGYNLEGFWTFPLMRLGIYGAVVDDFNISQVTPERLTSLDQTFFAINGFTKYEDKEREYLLVGSRTGLIYSYQISSTVDQVKLGPKGHLVNPSGVIHKNPNIQASLAFVRIQQQKTGIITVGEGGIYFYNDLNKKDSKGNLSFDLPKHAFQENTFVTAGSLPVQTVVDWDGDSMLDIVSGNSMGFIQFYKNRGDNVNPKFSDPELLKAGDRVIMVQGGYRGSVQGPGESRWGYTCPIVFDWNSDGLPDIVTGDINADYMVYLNIGTKESPRLDQPVILQCDGIDVIGTWRVRPGIAKVGDKLWFINQDRNDDLHLYHALDMYNLEDKGKLTLKGGIPIRASYHDYQGLIGRGKYELVDWDQDGKIDLLIGTYLNHAFPDKTNGLPFSLLKQGGKKEAMVLFMRNVGTNENPVFEFPKALKFKNKYIQLGIHACSPSATTLGGEGALNLVVAEENGKFIFYDRKDLSW